MTSLARRRGIGGLRGGFQRPQFQPQYGQMMGVDPRQAFHQQQQQMMPQQGMPRQMMGQPGMAQLGSFNAPMSQPSGPKQTSAQWLEEQRKEQQTATR